jgi:hypothetical protein
MSSEEDDLLVESVHDDFDRMMDRLVLVAGALVLLVAVGSTWSALFRYNRQHDGWITAHQGPLAITGIGAVFLIGLVSAVIYRHRLGRWFGVAATCIVLPTLATFQHQAVYEPTCTSYTGSRPQPPVEDQFDCAMGYGMGAIFVSGPAILVLALGIGTGTVLVPQNRGWARRSGWRSAS